MENILQPENGSVNHSFANVMHLTDAYGKIVGIIHAIAPFEFVDETGDAKRAIQHITQIFFSKGYVHVAHGFCLGYDDGLREERFFKVLGMEQIVAMIPGFASSIPTNIVYSIGLDKIEDKAKFYVFSIPAPLLTIPQINTSFGYQTFKKTLEVYRSEEQDIVVVGENNEKN